MILGGLLTGNRKKFYFFGVRSAITGETSSWAGVSGVCNKSVAVELPYQQQRVSATMYTSNERYDNN